MSGMRRFFNFKSMLSPLNRCLDLLANAIGDLWLSEPKE
jgi:hypothetical protein